MYGFLPKSLTLWVWLHNIQFKVKSPVMLAYTFAEVHVSLVDCKCLKDKNNMLFRILSLEITR